MKERHNIYRFVISCLLWMVLFTFRLQAGTELSDANSLAIEWRMTNDLNDLRSLMSEIRLASQRRLNTFTNQLARMKVKTDVYCQAQQEYIAMDDSLMNLMATYYEVWQMADDSVRNQQIRLQAQVTYEQSERFILRQDTALQRYQEQAKLYSKSSHTANQLEAVKGQELLLWNDIESRFSAAREAVETNTTLKKKLEKLETVYLRQKALSNEIQSIEYKSPLERAKDYLLSIAAIGIILMFLNVVVSKIQVYKQVRKNAKKMKEMMRNTNGDYPQI